MCIEFGPVRVDSVRRGGGAPPPPGSNPPCAGSRRHGLLPGLLVIACYLSFTPSSLKSTATLLWAAAAINHAKSPTFWASHFGAHGFRYLHTQVVIPFESHSISARLPHPWCFATAADTPSEPWVGVGVTACPDPRHSDWAVSILLPGSVVSTKAKRFKHFKKAETTGGLHSAS